MTINSITIIYGYKFESRTFLKDFYNIEVGKEFYCFPHIIDLHGCNANEEELYKTGIHKHLYVQEIPHDQLKKADYKRRDEYVVIGIELLSIYVDNTLPLTLDTFPSKPTKEDLYEKIPVEYREFFANLEPQMYTIQNDCKCCS